MATSQDDQGTQDISVFPPLTFGDVGSYAKEKSGCTSTSKAYKFMAEPGYLHDIKVTCNAELVRVSAKCFRSMKKSEPPHTLQVTAKLIDGSLAGQCSCVAGIGGYCHHVIGLLYYLALLKQLGHKSLPDELTCTSMKQRWSIPRGKKIQQLEIQNVLVKRPQLGASYSRYIKSNLYSPSTMYLTLTKEHFENCQTQPLFATVLPNKDQLHNIAFVQSKFGNVPKGCVLSYQQKMSSDYIINDFTCTAFPDLPLETAEERFDNSVLICLDAAQQATLDSLSITMEASLRIQQQTMTQSQNDVWHLLRKKEDYCK